MMHALVSVCSWGLSSDLKSPFGKFAVWEGSIIIIMVISPLPSQVSPEMTVLLSSPLFSGCLPSLSAILLKQGCQLYCCVIQDLG